MTADMDEPMVGQTPPEREPCDFHDWIEISMLGHEKLWSVCALCHAVRLEYFPAPQQPELSAEEPS